MNLRIRKQLESILDQKQALAASKALQGTDPDGLSAAIAEAKSYPSLLEIMQSRWGSDSVMALVLAVVVTIAAGILWSQKVKTTNVTLSVQTDNVYSHLRNTWQLATPIHAQVVHIDHVSSLHDAALGLSLDNNDSDLWCHLEGGQITGKFDEESSDGDCSPPQTDRQKTRFEFRRLITSSSPGSSNLISPGKRMNS